MEYVQLTNTDLMISRLGFGCEPLGGTDWGRVDEVAGRQAVSQAIDLGVNFFDTADIYGLGRSEQVLSQALGEKRHDVVIVSKFGVNWHENPDGGRAQAYYDSSPCRVVEALENSLRRLRVDCISLYLIHWPDPTTPIADTMEALRRCQEAGKIKYVGVSNFPVHFLREANQAMPLAAAEFQYSLVDRRAEQEQLSCCQELEIGVLAYGTLAQGLLTGKYGSESCFTKDDRRHRLPHFQGKYLEENLRILSCVKHIGERLGKSPSQVAVSWVLGNRAVSCAIVGAKTPMQIEENIGAVGWRLSQDDYEQLANVSSYTY